MMKHPGTTRNFESTLRELAGRGHEIELAFETLKGDGAEVVVERLRAEHPGLKVSKAPKGAKGRLPRATRSVRLAIDYLRYRERRYAAAGKLRERARSQAPAAIVRLAAAPVLRGPRSAQVMGRGLAAVERALPAPQPLVQWLRKRRADVLLVSPLVGLGSRQADYVRAARELRIPTGLLVHSWDNLTNKGLLRDVPDLVAVWNEAQAAEARELHAVAPQRIAVTGAPGFDHWFAREPSRDAAQFAADAGLPQDGTLLLYLCSSPFIAPDEVGFVRRWIAALRSAPRLAGARVLVRPHPQNAAQWAAADLGDARATVFPRAGANPVDEQARADFFDSMHHAAAVVGINTSALIEAAIVGRPVLTVLDPEFTGTQEGTLHFHHLAGEGGLLHVARSLDEHLGQLAGALAPDAAWHARNRRFLESFVRPFGLGRAAAPLVADAVERVASGRPAAYPRRHRLAHRAVRRALPAATVAKHKENAAARADAVDDARAAVRRLAEETEGPILAGPWVSEVGYELLYWVPFLRWAIEEHPGLAERLVVVSRGGSEHWYDGLGVRYADLFDVHTPEELRSRREEAALEATGGLNKQMTETAYDAELLAEGAERLGLAGHEVLHPSLMYKAYWRLVKRRELVSPAGGELFSYRPLGPPGAGVLAGELPEDFVAVRFYFRASFPATEENVAFARQTVETLAEQTDVVLLNPSIQVDDHWDFEPAGGGRVIRLDHLMTPRTNLAVQTAAIARARAFVGTYGGLAYLPPLLGVRSESVYSDPTRFKAHHGDLAEAVFGEPGYGSFAVHDVRDVDARTLLSGTVLG